MMDTNTTVFRVLFVCLGNICRSPLAEGIMRGLLKDAGLADRVEVDSAGILSYHQGEQPDSRMRMYAGRRGYWLEHKSRPVQTTDFYQFDLILGMDDRNVDDLKALAPTLEAEQKVQRMCDYCRLEGIDHVPDPYYGGASGFELVLDILENACQGLLAELQQRL